MNTVSSLECKFRSTRAGANRPKVLRNSDRKAGQAGREIAGPEQNCANGPARGYPNETVPLYDFICRACGREFEALVRPNYPAVCPACQSQDLERKLSTFAMTSREQTQAFADKKNKRVATIARADNAAMDREIEEHRREDHGGD